MPSPVGRVPGTFALAAGFTGLPPGRGRFAACVEDAAGAEDTTETTGSAVETLGEGAGSTDGSSVFVLVGCCGCGTTTLGVSGGELVARRGANSR